MSGDGAKHVLLQYSVDAWVEVLEHLHLLVEVRFCAAARWPSILPQRRPLCDLKDVWTRTVGERAIREDDGGEEARVEIC